MTNRISLLSQVLMLLALTSCANLGTQPSAVIAKPDAISPDTTRQDISPVNTQATSPDDGIADVPKPVISSNRAVIALLDKSRLDMNTGQREAAGASLERALRIEPRNAWLWHELAQLRLAQGQYAQAVSLAQKSTSFAGSERRLLALNWRVIANARVAQGDSAGAEQAFKRAEEFEK